MAFRLAARFLVASLLFSGCLERGPLAPPTLEPLEISAEGGWFRDRAGRVVLLRGANYTLLETGGDIGPFGGPGEATLAEMERLGMNVVRLPLSWKGLEPREGRLDPRYLIERVDPVVRLAAAHGLAVVLSLRPSPLGPCTGDPAVPSWVCEAIASAPEPRCAFWQATAGDDRSLRAHFARVWAFVAEHYREDARVVAFDPIDEPTGGPCFASAPFLSGQLEPYFALLRRRIRKMGATQILFWEPPSGNGLDGTPRTEIASPVAFAPHIWTRRFGPPPGAANDLAEAYRRAAAAAEIVGGPLFVGAYGGDEPLGPATGASRASRVEDDEGRPPEIRGTSAPFVLRSLAELDRHLASGAYEALRPGSSMSPAARFGPAEVVLAHPYARRIAGIPREMTFSPRTLELRLRFDDDPARRPPDPTEIFVPESLYPDGVEVRISPDGDFRFDESTQRLLVYRGPARSHEVVLHPASD